MKRLSVSLLLGSIASVILASAFSITAEASTIPLPLPRPSQIAQQEVPDDYPAWQCFSADQDGDDDDEDESRVVGLWTTNFGLDVVQVNELAMLCQSARLYEAGTEADDIAGDELPDPQMLACYDIEFGSDPGDPIVIREREEEGPLGPDTPHGMVVRRAVYLCEEATLTTAASNGSLALLQTIGAALGETTGKTWVCYSVESEIEAGVVLSVVTDRLGLQQASLGDLSLFCEFAQQVLSPAPDQYELACEDCSPELEERWIGCFETANGVNERRRSNEEERRRDSDEDDRRRLEVSERRPVQPARANLLISTAGFGDVQATLSSTSAICTSMTKTTPRPFEVSLD